MITEYRDGVCLDLGERKKVGRRRMHGVCRAGNRSISYEHTDDIKNNKYFRGIHTEAKDYRDISRTRLYSHGLLDMLHLAFIKHHSIEISPDHVWLLISQALSTHEEVSGILGKVYDLPKPKMNIIIRADDFVKGSPDNNWKGIFPQFEAEIRKSIPETLYNLMSNKAYSTTTELERICYSVCLMDSMKRYFSYSTMTECQIPKIYLKGNSEDWELLFHNCSVLSREKLELDWWFPVILAILQKFVDVFKKKSVDTDFWRSIYKYEEESGGPEMSGWITAFFPYILQKGKLKSAWWKQRKIEFLQKLQEQNEEEEGVKGNVSIKDIWKGTGCYEPGKLPNGLNVCPFIWLYHGEQLPYMFYAGFLGLMQLEPNDDDKEIILTPRLGWAVGMKSKNDNNLSGRMKKLRKKKRKSPMMKKKKKISTPVVKKKKVAKQPSISKKKIEVAKKKKKKKVLVGSPEKKKKKKVVVGGSGNNVKKKKVSVIRGKKKKIVKKK